MTGDKKIKSALISVFYKDHLEPIVKKLGELGVTVFSTGGTQEFIEKSGVKVTPVEELTSYPSILGGRVKTLHPKIFGGILSRRELQSDVAQLEEYKIPQIDLVIVDLYPFEETVSKHTSSPNPSPGGEGGLTAETEIIEKIDIGGISLIRAAAKNFNDVVIVPSKNEYSYLLKILKDKKGVSTLEDRKFLATKAFGVSSNYDTAIHTYFSGAVDPLSPRRGDGSEAMSGSAVIPIAIGTKSLRYGENPHQKGTFYGDFEKMFAQLNGKELSYNNLLDIDAAVNLMAEFSPPTHQREGSADAIFLHSGELKGAITFAILKHNNACGIASGKNLTDVWKNALAGDPVSAFGGILITNANVDEVTAKEINKLFFEVIIAPSYDKTALTLLKQKKNRIILRQKSAELSAKLIRTALNGYLEQDRDFKTESADDMKPVTKAIPSKEKLNDLVFANKIVKHSKSNTIVLAKNGQLLASGIGQTSRVDALKQAILKAKNFGFDLRDAVMASDAFFPFPDCVEIAHNEGITAVVQPGGSVKDKDSIDYCDKNKMSMVFTGVRHFKH
ncbi:MAG: bifunctional phosphoribosylaminoimidazolecarboxamide formyltransferase/IMP cyclohydrolase [Bacteroidetes bacterium]|nr:MAG: bifunctional phosphoribosylaminoimidazolecarboxamide formyltransferase/IMP cyclohydrolase [Bacteroidota bacterium]